jgi:uncharacterized protein YlbG (UPF0298 family)
MLKRKSLIIYFRNPKVLKQIEKFGDIMYYTKKKKYAIIYVNEEELDSKVKEIQNLKLVKKVEESLFDTGEYQINF